jgi:adenylosuccinate synthase
VAVRAYADTQDLHEVATILSQNDTVREWKAAIPHSRSWDEYLNQAKNYVRMIQAAAFTKLEKQQELG